MLSVSPYSQEISSRLKPLRDFFIISFFLILGSRVSLSTIETMAVPAALFIVLILVAKPLVVMAQMWAMGYGARTGFLTGISMSQISEFSLILVAIGERAGQLPNGILALTTLVGLVTMAGSSYLIMHSERIYSAVSGFLGFAGRKSHALEKKSHSADCILMGYNRIGYSILKAMEETGKECLVIDFNPTTVKEIAKKGVQITYGDVWDTEFLRSLGLDKVKMVVSTVPDKGANMLIVSRARKANPKAVVIATARQISEAVELYGAGADYVILPHFLGGRYVSAMIEKDGFDRREYEHERKEHLKELKEREELGHEHPKRGS
jgi:Trk K+ transport system NAD-binding subunit